MRPTLIFLAALLLSLAWISLVSAQPSRPAASLSLAQAERNAVELKQGMALEDVQKLLGKPRRTALKNAGSSASQSSQGTLQWTYSWAGSSSPGSLLVEFAAKTPQEWYVNSWEWSTY